MPRNKQFDEKEVLEKAMNLFWQKGYQGTSIQDLVTHLGINRGSLYDTYQGKEELFKRALVYYRKTYRRQMKEAVEAEGSALQTLRSLFEASVRSVLEDQEKKGCFLVNTSTELTCLGEDYEKLLTENYLEYSGYFTQILQKAADQGEIPAGLDLEIYGKYLFTLYNGLRIVSRFTDNEKDLTGIVEVALGAIPVR